MAYLSSAQAEPTLDPTLQNRSRTRHIGDPLDTSILFAAPFPEYVSGDFIGVHVDSMTGLRLRTPLRRASVTRSFHGNVE